jgi:hypothetical protein
MVGNDIVDLMDRDSDPASLHPHYDARVFTESERLSIDSATDSSRHRWRLWAAKEACYKLERQMHRETVFSPRHFEAILSGGTGERIRGVVSHEGRRFRVEITEDLRWIHALAVPDGAGFGSVVRGVERHGSDIRHESEAVRELLCRELAARLRVPRAALQVRKQDRIPFVWLGGERLPLSLSFSHHGEFAAFAYSAEEARA